MRYGHRSLDPRNKSLSSYEVLGQTYFLVRDRIEKRRVYETGTRFTMNPVAEESPLINRIDYKKSDAKISYQLSRLQF